MGKKEQKERKKKLPLENQSFHQDYPKKCRLKYQGARDVIRRKSHSRPTPVPLTRFTNEKIAIFINIATLGAS